MKKLFFILGVLLCAAPAWGTTYYISFSAGNNTNNGTSESTPWKSHPWMQTAAGCGGAAATYSHAAGDQFIFKQGDTWPNACFDMSIQAGGTVSGGLCTLPDVYTFDPTWGTPGGTTGNLGQAVGVYKFDAGGAVISGTDGWNDFIYDNDNNCITFNGMELTRMFWNAAAPGAFGNAQMFQLQQSTFVVASKVWAHGWTYSNPGTAGNVLEVMVGNGNGTGVSQPYSVGTRLTGSVVDGINSGGAGVSNSGSAMFAIQICDNNIIRNVTNGCLLNVNGIAHDNQIGPINLAFDTGTGTHENCIEPIDMQGSNSGSAGASTVYIYNNLIHDCVSVNILTQGAASNAGWEIDYIWNNVDYVGATSSPPIPFQFAVVSTANTSSQVHVWNNTIVGGATAVCMRTFNNGGTGNFGVLDFQNNHCISTSGLNTLSVAGNTQTFNNNPTQTVAAATGQGYTSAQTPYVYFPTIGGTTIGAGANLLSLAGGQTLSLARDTTYGGPRTTNLRPSSGAWDAGAYQFTGAAHFGGSGIK